MDLQASNFLCLGIVKLVLITQILFLVHNVANASVVDYSYCRKYEATPCDKPNQVDDEGRPFVYMGETYSKKFFLSNLNTTASYFQGAFSVCERYGMQLASIKTACDYGVVEKWFIDQYPIPQ